MVRELTVFFPFALFYTTSAKIITAFYQDSVEPHIYSYGELVSVGLLKSQAAWFGAASADILLCVDAATLSTVKTVIVRKLVL